MVDLYALRSRQEVAQFLDDNKWTLAGGSFFTGCLIGAALCIWAAMSL